MKTTRILAIIMVAALLAGTMPVLPDVGIFGRNSFVANAAEESGYLDRNLLKEAINSWKSKQVVILDHKPANGTVATVTSVSSDGESVLAGPSNDTSGIIYIWAANGGRVKVGNGFAFPYNETVLSIDLSALDTSKMTSMYRMFYDCSALEAVQLSGIDTSNVTNMKEMFDGCKCLKSLDLSGLDTRKVSDMNHMFHNCWRLESVNLKGIVTSEVKDMSYMFAYCQALTTLDLSGFDTGKVERMEWMFEHCAVITKLDLSSFNTENVTDMEGMFNSCYDLQELDVHSFNTEKVVDMSYMFQASFDDIDLDLSSFTTGNVQGMTAMFAGSSINTLDISQFVICTDNYAAILEKLNWASGNNLKSVKCTEEVYQKFGFDESVERIGVGLQDYFVKGCSLDITDGVFNLVIYTKFPKAYNNFLCTITLPDGTKTSTLIGRAEKVKIGEDTYTVFPAYVAAKDIGSNIEVKVSQRDRLLGTVYVSVTQYAYALKKQNSDYSEFVDALLNYGAYANAYFKGYFYNNAYYTLNDFWDAREKCKTSHTGVDNESYVGTSLVLENEIILRHYFALPVANSVKKGDLYCVEHAFNPTQFDETFGGYDYSVYDYLYTGLCEYGRRTSNAWSHLCLALYQYSQAALNLKNIK